MYTKNKKEDCVLYTIIEYNENYENKVKTLISSIFVHEYGYKNCKEEIFNEDLNEYLSLGGNFWIAINDNNDVIGTIGAKKLNHEALELKRIYVHKDYRGKGLAHELLNTFEYFARLGNYKYLKLSTRSNMERAISFYRKHSFIDDPNILSNQNVVYLHKEL